MVRLPKIGTCGTGTARPIRTILRNRNVPMELNQNKGHITCVNQNTEYDFAAPRPIVERYLILSKIKNTEYLLYICWTAGTYANMIMQTTRHAQLAQNRHSLQLKGFKHCLGWGSPGCKSWQRKLFHSLFPIKANFSDFGYVVAKTLTKFWNKKSCLLFTAI